VARALRAARLLHHASADLELSNNSASPVITSYTGSYAISAKIVCGLMAERVLDESNLVHLKRSINGELRTVEQRSKVFHEFYISAISAISS
jgi:hypothetical protein